MNDTLQEYMDKGYSIVWDIDGTLTEARWAGKDLHMFNETSYSLKKLHFDRKNLHIKPLPVMVAMVAKIKGDQYVISNTHDSIEDRNKDVVLDEFFPKIIKERRFYTRTRMDKIEVLQILAEKDPEKNFVFISDSLEELIEANDYFHDNGIGNVSFYHTSSLFL